MGQQLTSAVPITQRRTGGVFTAAVDALKPAGPDWVGLEGVHPLAGLDWVGLAGVAGILSNVPGVVLRRTH